ncbi:MAG: pyridoxal-phosphate-dependent aminotransferase family protein [Acidobacteriota bacterium]
MRYRSGRHFLQIPGPTNVPDRILRAMDRPTIDHRSLQFSGLAEEIFERLKPVCGSTGPVLIFPGSGTGGWEAALVNTLSPGDEVLLCENGFFAAKVGKTARKLGLRVRVLEGDWRRAVDPEAVERTLAQDAAHLIRALLVVHNETSTGATTLIDSLRKAIDRARHPALLMVDSISSLGCVDYRHDEWGIDVTIASSQKGLMLPPGICFNVPSEKALKVSGRSRLARSYWDWRPQLQANEKGFFPYTPATNLLFGLREALRLIDEEGLRNVYLRHQRLAEATRRAVEGWGLKIFCAKPEERSVSVTAVQVPESVNADEVRALILDRYDLSLGAGLGKLAGKVFRIGHLGSFNALMLMAALSGIEMGMAVHGGLPFQPGGVLAAMQYLQSLEAS